MKKNTYNDQVDQFFQEIIDLFSFDVNEEIVSDIQHFKKMALNNSGNWDISLNYYLKPFCIFGNMTFIQWENICRKSKSLSDNFNLYDDLYGGFLRDIEELNKDENSLVYFDKDNALTDYAKTNFKALSKAFKFSADAVVYHMETRITFNSRNAFGNSEVSNYNYEELSSVLYLYRHSLELVLKYSVIKFLSIPNFKEKLLSDEGEKKILKALSGHDLSMLWNLIENILKLRWPNNYKYPDIKQARKIKELIHKLDKTGQSFRYSGEKINSLLEIEDSYFMLDVLTDIDFKKLQKHFNRLFRFIERCSECIVEEHEEILSESINHDS